MNACCKRFFGTTLLILACVVMKPNTAAAQTPTPVVVTNATTKPRDHFFPATFQGNSVNFGGDYFTVNQPTRLYADAGTSSVFSITISNTTAGSIELTVSGYLVTIP